MNIFLSPDIAYILLVIGFIIAILACFAPGTGLLELGALFMLVLAGYIIMNLSVHWWALIVIGLSFAPFLIAIRSRTVGRQTVLLAISCLLLGTGSAFLFDVDGRYPGVHPALIVVLSLLVTLLAAFLARKSIEVLTSPKMLFDPDTLVGMTGKAITDIKGEGSVYVRGENWSATSPIYIPSGKIVRVMRREGLTLEVEPEPVKSGVLAG